MFLLGYKLMNVKNEIDAAFSNGSKEVFEAESVEALADQIGIDPATLGERETKYNRDRAGGHYDLLL